MKGDCDLSVEDTEWRAPWRVISKVLHQCLTSEESTHFRLAWVVKNPPANAGDSGALGLIPGSEKYPGVGHGYWLQCSCLENSMDGRAWQATVHRVTKSGTLLRQLSTHAHCPIFCYTCTHEKGRPVPITQRAIFSSQGNPKTHIALWVFAFAFFSRPSSRLLEVHQLCSLGTKEPRKNFRGAFHPGSPQPRSSQVWKRPLTFTFSRS